MGDRPRGRARLTLPVLLAALTPARLGAFLATALVVLLIPGPAVLYVAGRGRPRSTCGTRRGRASRSWC